VTPPEEVGSDGSPRRYDRSSEVAVKQCLLAVTASLVIGCTQPESGSLLLHDKVSEIANQLGHAAMLRALDSTDAEYRRRSREMDEYFKQQRGDHPIPPRGAPLGT
jgi:hypothetical protein